MADPWWTLKPHNSLDITDRVQRWTETIQDYYRAIDVRAAHQQTDAAHRKEVELLDNVARGRGSMLRYIAFVAGGDESTDPQLSADRLVARAEAAEAARDAALRDVEMWREAYKGTDHAQEQEDSQAQPYSCRSNELGDEDGREDTTRTNQGQ